MEELVPAMPLHIDEQDRRHRRKRAPESESALVSLGKIDGQYGWPDIV
jgi:hypothetical protein